MSLLKEANEHYRKGYFQKAYQLYQKIIKLDPKFLKVLSYNLEQCQKNLSKDELTSLNKEANTTKTYQQKIKLNNSKYEARIEKFENFILKGWAVDKNDKSKVLDLDVYIDDILYTKVKTNIRRGDLIKAEKSNGLGGFLIQILPEILTEHRHKISLKFDNNELILTYENTVPSHADKSLSTLCNCNIDNKRISIIVPIYNAATDVDICIQRLIKYTPKNIDIILINDASTDKNVNIILNKIKDKRFRIYENKKNLGFTKTVNRGISLAGKNDVILLNSDARVTQRWIEGLLFALSSDDKIATVTPMSDRAGAFSAPQIGNSNELPEGVTEEEFAISFRRFSKGFYSTVPTGNGFCMYIRRECIDEIGILDEQAFPRGYGEENDFCMRARKAGWRNIIDDRTYVFHDRQKSFAGEKNHLIREGRAIVDKRYPDYKKAISIFTDSPLINAARFQAKRAYEYCQKEKILPRYLFVISTLTGGTPQTNRDLMLALYDKIEPWLLHCDSKTISLFKVNKNKKDELIFQYTLKEPVEVLTHISHEYDKVVTNLLFKFDFELVHIRHLAWHSLSLPRLAKISGAKVVMSFHDYYVVCPTVKLLDENNIFCSGNCTKTKGSCMPDLWQKDSLPDLKTLWIANWQDKFSTALSYCDAYITTHESARKIILSKIKIPDNKFYVIPHGRDFKQFYQLSAPFKNGEVLKIIVPGNISEPKGSLIIKKLLEVDKNARLHFHILGRTNIKFTHPRLTVHGEYKREDFHQHVAKIKPHIGAVFSIWNETWCHTLTELWSVGVPCVVTSYDTLKERVENSKAGWVLSDRNIETMYQYIVKYIADEEKLKEITQNVYACQQNVLKPYQNKDMAKCYLKVYGGIK